MRLSIVSLSALVGVLGSAGLTAACSSKPSSGETGDGGSSSSSSSGGGSDAGEDAPAPCAQFADDASLTAPTVSFKNDVMPLFEHACGLSSSCHGNTTDVAQRGIYLGCDIVAHPSSCSDSNPAPAVYMGLITSPSMPLEENCMPFITAGNPEKSYLMHKVDGDQNCTVTCCTPNNTAVQAAEGQAGGTITGAAWCGTFMPYQVAVLPAGPICGGTTNCSLQEARDTVRAWIAQGAMNN